MIPVFFFFEVFFTVFFGVFCGALAFMRLDETALFDVGFAVVTAGAKKSRAVNIDNSFNAPSQDDMSSQK